MKNDLLKTVSDLNNLIQNGKALEAFEEYYDDAVVMQENETAPRIGKALNREYEKAFLNGVTEWKKALIKNVSVGDEVSMVEWEMEMTHSQWGKMSRSQVSVQKWKNGKIISEKFYYGT